MFYEYSQLWYVSINFDKTKIMTFGTRQDQSFNFSLGSHKSCICTDFKYLGFIFSRNRHFHQTKKHNDEQARKAMHVLFKRIRNLDIPLYLFDHVILPIALYGCEIWRVEKIAKILKNYTMIPLERLLICEKVPLHICYMQN